MHRWRAGGPWESRRWSLDCGGTDPQARGGGRRQEDGGTKHGHARGCRFGSEVIGRPPTREVSFTEKREARPGSRVKGAKSFEVAQNCVSVSFPGLCFPTCTINSLG